MKEKKLQEAKQVLEIENTLMLLYKDISDNTLEGKEVWTQILDSKRKTIEYIRQEMGMFASEETSYSENRGKDGKLYNILNETRIQTINEQKISKLINATLEIEKKLLGNDFYKEYENDSENVKRFIREIRKNKEKEINLTEEKQSDY